ncbi:MAG: hypothetical protein GXP14_05895 [Gammaproteobacteria bacterium]|nr:hypothetical protein [Gammaproteobacteria bacterium]
MNTTLLRRLFFLSTVMGLIMPHISLAEVNNDKPAEPQRYFWYDGDEKRSVWVNPELIAEFKVQTEANAQLKSLDTTKKINTQLPFVRFLKIEADDTSIQAVGKSVNEGDNSQFSPVLHDAASISGIKRALPGNVLVQMKFDWSQEKIEAWFEKYNLIAIKSLTFAPNAFLIQTQSGLDSLDIANRIYETGDVVLASPNWWQEMVPR